ncbi:MAG TPA: four helix bundle protein [Tepidisphaeraceae bacterium]|nr:four helix bundle protein [Tepidisphaeraceae bacterium]
MNADELKRRTFDFAVRVIRLCRALPSAVEGRAVAGQLVRSATSVGANYRAACKARSRAEFIARMGVVEEEADESAYWLELIVASAQLRPGQVRELLREAVEFSKIFGTSRTTASRNRKDDRKGSQ